MAGFFRRVLGSLDSRPEVAGCRLGRNSAHGRFGSGWAGFPDCGPPG
jgi:hypothetical protein